MALLAPTLRDVFRYGGAQPFLEQANFGRTAGRINGTNGRFNVGTSDAAVDGWSDATYLVRVRAPASWSSGAALLSKTASGSIDGLFLTLNGTGGNLQLQRPWSGTDANYITNDMPVQPLTWMDVVIVIRDNTTGSLSIYAAPTGQPMKERAYGTATDGTGTIDTADGANNLLAGNRTTATTVAFQGDYHIVVGIKRALTFQEVVSLARDPREFIGDRDCWVWTVLGHQKFVSGNVSAMNLALNAIATGTVRVGTGGGSQVMAPGPFAATGGVDHLRRFWAVRKTPAAGGITGDGAGTIVFTGSGAGSVAVQGAGAGTIVFTGAGAGTVAVQGAGAGTILFTGSGTGTVAVQGAGAGTIIFTGSGAGTVAIQGAGAGTIIFTGSGTGGAPAIVGDGAGTIVFSGSGTGTVAVQGAGVGTIVFTGSGAGSVAVVGAGAGVIIFTGSGTGTSGGAVLTVPTIRQTAVALAVSRTEAALGISRTTVELQT
jgi:hypothetical protein